MLLAEKVINRGSYVHMSHYFDSIESLIESIYASQQPKVKPSRTKQLRESILRFLKRLNPFKH